MACSVTTTLGREPIVEKAGSIDGSLGLTEIATGGAHYIYGGAVKEGTSLRWRVADPSTTTERLNGTAGHCSTGHRPSVDKPVSVRAAAPTVFENGPATSFIVSRTNAQGPLTALLAVSGTATAGVHYTTAFPTHVDFANGIREVTISLQPIDDPVRGVNHSLILTVSPDGSYGTASPASAEIDILDADTPVSVSATHDGAEQGPASATFSVARDTTEGSLSVSYELSEPEIAIGGATASTPNGAELTVDGKRSTYWLSDPGHAGPYDGQSSITYTFSSVQNLGRMRVSGINGPNAAFSAKDVDVLVSLDGTTFTSIGKKLSPKASHSRRMRGGRASTSTGPAH